MLIWKIVLSTAKRTSPCPARARQAASAYAISKSAGFKRTRGQSDSMRFDQCSHPQLFVLHSCAVLHRHPHALQAVTAGVREKSNKHMQRMLQSEPPWWNALRRAEHKEWMNLFMRCDEFKSWFAHDESASVTHSQVWTLDDK
jgi:hypothetical protein